MLTKVKTSSISELRMIHNPKKQKLKKSLFSLFLLKMMPNKIPQKVNANLLIMLSASMSAAPAYRSAKQEKLIYTFLLQLSQAP